MNTSFRVSLFYLLLIIPQHGNSPLPVMESWLQKDQDDGFVQRDMTSSPTGGDESFGTAHQTYQNSLIRKKKADDTGDLLPSVGYRKFGSEINRNELKSHPLFDGRYVNKDFDVPAAESRRGLGRFANSDDTLRPDSVNYLRSNAKVDRLTNHLGRNFEDNTNVVSSAMNDEGMDNSPAWAMCHKTQSAYHAAPIQSPKIHNPINMPLENSYPPIESEFRSHEGGRNEELEESKMKIPQNIDDSDYYENAESSVGGEYDDDYNQMMDNGGFIRKREEAKQSTNKKEDFESGNVMLDDVRNFGKNKAFNEDSSAFDTVHENADSMLVGNSGGMEDMKATPDSNTLWQLSSDGQSDALNKVVRNSQRALQQFQQFHQKLYSKHPEEIAEYKEDEKEEQSGNKFGGKSLNFDERRLKREDEDEQKNMKTGTDEGGGGEYEDEEGKGHKDEEEYYEDADLSDDESGNDVPTNENDSNDKYVKREIQGETLERSNTDKVDDNSQDYELTLANAPVEHSEKSRKSSYREGEKTKDNCVRKGVKIWDQWGKWSPCSVTCGVGRSTRWRHCIGGGCAQGEKEAQIRRCTNPAC